MEEAEILELIIETAVEEVIHVILASKCCHWSKRKWKKIMGKLEHTKEERSERVRRKVSGDTEKKQDIMKYAHKISSV